MKRVDGFTLIELLVALSCMVITLSVFISGTMNWYGAWLKAAHGVQEQVILNAALDVLRRDCACAPSDASYWYEAGPHAVAWRSMVAPTALKFCVVKGRLERCEGTIDERTHTWHSHAVSVLATDIQGLRVVLHSRQQGNYSAAEFFLNMRDNREEKILVRIGEGV